MRDMPVAKIAERFPSFFLAKDAQGSLHLKRSHKHYAQVQGELAVMRVTWCDFVVFTAHDTDSLHIERIDFDEDYWQDCMLPSLCQFFTKHIAPEILTRRLLKARCVVPKYCMPLQWHITLKSLCTLSVLRKRHAEQSVRGVTHAARAKKKMEHVRSIAADYEQGSC